MAWTAAVTWTTSELVTSSRMNTHVRDNLIVAGYPVAASVSALNTLWGGTPPDGAHGGVEFADGSSRSIVHVRYDSTLAKWVSPADTIVNEYGTGTAILQTSSTSGAVATPEGNIQNLKACYDAGLRPSLRFAFRGKHSFGGDITGLLRVHDYTSAEASSAKNLIANNVGNKTLTCTVAATDYYAVQDWVQPTVTVTEAHGIVDFVGIIDNASYTANFERVDIKLRWVG